MSRSLRRRYGRAAKRVPPLVAYEIKVEDWLIAQRVRPGEASVWMSNHGSFIREGFNSKAPAEDIAERILRFHREESVIPWGEP